jgi:hypothetical protein
MTFGPSLKRCGSEGGSLRAADAGRRSNAAGAESTHRPVGVEKLRRKADALLADVVGQLREAGLGQAAER